MRRPAAGGALVLAALVTLLSCGPRDGGQTLSLQVALPSDWESLLDMDVLGAPGSTPYIGTVRVIVQNGGDVRAWDFPWDDHGASIGSADLDQASTLRVQAITAGRVILHGDVSSPGSGDIVVPLVQSGGFSPAGTLLHLRQSHSAVAVGDTVMVLGGNLSTRVIEALTPSGEGFVSAAYAASLVYPRSGQEVLHDAPGNRLFIFKGATEVQDNLYEVVDLGTQFSTLMTISVYRRDYFPTYYDQNIYLLGGFDQYDQWLINALVIDTVSLNESVETLMGIYSERSNYRCINDGSILVCFGGSYGLDFLDEVLRFSLDTGINLPITSLIAPKEHVSSAYLSNGEILISGGIGDTGYLDDIEIIQALDGSTAILGSGLVKQRANHVSVLVDNSHLLIVGGLEPSGTSRSAEILDLTTGESTLLPWKMRVPRVGHTATRLPDGRVLVAGGNMTDRTVEVWNPPVW